MLVKNIFRERDGQSLAAKIVISAFYAIAESTLPHVAGIVLKEVVLQADGVTEGVSPRIHRTLSAPLTWVLSLRCLGWTLFCGFNLIFIYLQKRVIHYSLYDYETNSNHVIRIMLLPVRYLCTGGTSHFHGNQT